MATNAQALSIRNGSQIEIKPIAWMWKPFIPYGKVTIIEGDGGDGKSTLMLAIAAMMTQGIQPPSLIDGRLERSAEIQPQSIFYVSTEDDSEDTALPRFLRNGGNRSLFFDNDEKVRHFELTESDLETAIRQSKARLLIFDPFQSFLPKRTHLNDVTSMRNLFSMLTRVASKQNAAIVLIGHLNKNENGKDLYRTLGSVDIGASVRSILKLTVDKDDPAFRTLQAIKSNFDDACYVPIGVRMDKEKHVTLEEITSPAPTTKIGKAVLLLVELLADGPKSLKFVNSYLESRGIDDKTRRRAREKIGAEKFCDDRGKTLLRLNG